MTALNHSTGTLASKPVRFGVLGCADVATRRVLPALQATEDGVLQCLASRYSEKARCVAGKFNSHVAPTYRDVLSDPSVDAVYIPLPNSLHYDWITEALGNGKHVLAEKPLTTSYVDTCSVLDQASSYDLVLQENFMFLEHPQHYYVRRIMQEGAIGELHSISATFTIPPRGSNDIRNKSSLGGGTLLDNGVYPLKIAQFFLGANLDIIGSTFRVRDDVDVGGHVLLSSPDGISADLRFGMEDVYSSRYALHGSEGNITIERAFTPPSDYRPVVHIETNHGAYRKELDSSDQYTRSIIRFIRSIRENGSCARLDIRQHAELVERVRVSSKVHHLD